MRLLLLLLIALLPFVPASRGNEETPPAIVLEVDGFGKGAEHGVIVAVWPDGVIVWSGDQEKGGPPYRTGAVDAAKLRDFLARLEKDGVFKKDADFLVHLGPDSDFHSILLRSGKKSVALRSWHELFEANPKLVVTSHGVTSLDGQKRDDLLRADKKEYQEFRKLWGEIRSFTKELIPKEGKPYKGELKLKE
jgi:hypothetical protein